MTNYQGIDYSLGKANRNPDTGIHYGVISSHSLSDYIYEVMSDGADYGKPTCPKCNNHESVIDMNVTCPTCENLHRIEFNGDCREDTERFTFGDYADWIRDSEHCMDDYACAHCHLIFGSESAFSDESLGWAYEGEGYKLQDCLDTDVFVIESPFYTYAQYCSPCVPGACNLDSPIEVEPDHRTGTDGRINRSPRAYCLGHDWFEGNKAPYRVFKVSDDSEVLPEEKVGG